MTGPASPVIWPSLVELATASAIALAAIDEWRLGQGVTTALVAVRVIVAATLLGLIAFDGSLHRVNRTEPALTLLFGWLLWAGIASAASFGGLAALTQAGLFAVVAAGAIVAALRDGSSALARIGVFGFAGYMAAASLLVIGGALDAFNDDNRLMLASLEPNQLARLCAIAMVCGLWLVIRNEGLYAWLGAATGLVALGTVFASGSRTGLAALVVGIAVMAVHGSRRVLSVVALVMLLTLGAAAVLDVIGFGPSSVSITERLEASPDGSTTTLSGRDTLWPEVWGTSLDQPVTGHGLGTDRRLIAEHLDVGWAPQHAHNLLLHLLLTTGFVGALVLVVALSRGLWLAARWQRPLEFALLLIVVVDGISEPVIRVPSFGWLAIAGPLAVLASVRGASNGPVIDLREPDLTLT